MTTPDAPPVLTERHGHVLLITLNRPRALNSVNAALSTALGEALEQLDADPDLRVGVLTGAGRAFCAGADLRPSRPVSRSRRRATRSGASPASCVTSCPTPLVAAVNGSALGGGTEAVLACDLAVIDPKLRSGYPR